MENDARLVSLGRRYIEIMDSIKDLEEERSEIKQKIAEILEEEGISYKEIPVGETEIYKFKNNFRSTKSFDKDGIAKEIGWEREDIDYVGVSKAVEHNLINSEKVKQYQATNQSSFITVRVAYDRHRKKG